MRTESDILGYKYNFVNQPDVEMQPDCVDTSHNRLKYYHDSSSEYEHNSSLLCSLNSETIL
jgi:hypothetical protein